MNDTETNVGDDSLDGTEGDNDRRSIIRIVLAELALVALIFAGVAALIRGASAPDPADAASAAASPTVNLADLPDTTADVYRYAADHAMHFTEIPCFCGCDGSLDHRNLEDCFVNATGDWDAHASGCGVCTAEAIAAREQLDAGVAISDVRQSIIDRFGPPPAA
ncbi:MAG: PCYCGC motif-containing (lipo)protein [Ilumatobacteraceae bacterium]